jgi:hypothetical protein
VPDQGLVQTVWTSAEESAEITSSVLNAGVTMCRSAVHGEVLQSPASNHDGAEHAECRDAGRRRAN